MKQFLENLFSILNEKQKKSITILTIVNILLNILLIVFSVTFNRTVLGGLYSIFRILLAMFEVGYTLAVFKISGVKFSEIFKKKQEDTIIGFGILEDKVKVQKNVELPTIKYNPLMLEFILKGELIFSKQIVYAELFELASRKIISIENNSGDFTFVLNNPNILKHTQNYNNILSNNFESYEGDGLFCFENLFLTKFIFPASSRISASEIEKNFENGFYQSRSEDGMVAISKMMMYEARKQDLIDETKFTALFPIILTLNVLIGFVGLGIGALFNVLCILAYLLNTLITVALIFNSQKHFATFSKYVANTTMTYIDSIATKTLDNSLNISELLNLMILAHDIDLSKAYEKYVALSQGLGVSDTPVIDIDIYVDQLRVKEQEEIALKKAQKEQAKQQRKQQKANSKVETTNAGKLVDEEKLENLNNEIGDISEQDFNSQVDDFLEKNNLCEEQISSNKSKINKEKTENVNLNENLNANLFSTFEATDTTNPNELGKNPFNVESKKGNFAGVKNSFDITDEYYENEKGEKVIKGHSVDVYGSEGYEAIRLDSTILKGEQDKLKPKQEEPKKKRVIIDDTKWKKGLKNLFRNRKQEERNKKHFETLSVEDIPKKQRINVDETVKLKSTNLDNTINGEKREEHEMNYDNFMDAINRYFDD